MSNRRALDVIQVDQPCPKSWEEMAGDDKRRFCTHCQKFVHNLSAMPTDEAERLVCSQAGNLCVRFARDPQTNAVMTLNYQTMPKTSRRRALLVIASIVGACGISATWAALKVLRKPAPQPTVVMGEMLQAPQEDSSATNNE